VNNKTYRFLPERTHREHIIPRMIN